MWNFRCELDWHLLNSEHFVRQSAVRNTLCERPKSWCIGCLPELWILFRSFWLFHLHCLLWPYRARRLHQEWWSGRQDSFNFHAPINCALLLLRCQRSFVAIQGKTFYQTNFHNNERHREGLRGIAYMGKQHLQTHPSEKFVPKTITTADQPHCWDGKLLKRRRLRIKPSVPEKSCKGRADRSTAQADHLKVLRKSLDVHQGLPGSPPKLCGGAHL